MVVGKRDLTFEAELPPETRQSEVKWSEVKWAKIHNYFENFHDVQGGFGSKWGDPVPVGGSFWRGTFPVTTPDQMVGHI